ncbi:uncharacterized protein EI97DRAFT_442164 [Westerdykella ornata]|uniref:Uncharacterized protein n=1 Tax=Westerdykella ornata TaxID=318751 RepID=A0A6A6JKN9_WESOR|nr:uncharacterized protein EI97DRAFT_442164 [Westerdykella ornata]KAF2276795.1 hypothetical protein EI97DRAFT_442164 [Westerdykella ornata]
MKTAVILASVFSLALAGPIHTRQNNLQTFSGALGGIEATPIVDSGNPNRPFQVKGDTFVNLAAALQRSCDQQFNACANAANGGDQSLSVSDCQAQKDQCSAASNGNNGNGNQGQNQNQNQNQNQDQGQNQNGGNAGNVCRRKTKRNNKQ